ncbi:MAG: hypothetical protein Q8N26_27160 [Myxococcales bacterium]|nr:hypothetical protein [Myxococcales bacterium]
MDEGRSLRAVLEATQAKLKQVTLELAALKAASAVPAPVTQWVSPKGQANVVSRLAHLERSAAEREARDEHRLAEHRARERALRDRVEALEQQLATETKAHRETQKLLTQLTKANRALRLQKDAKPSRPKSGPLSAIAETVSGAKKRVKRLEAELDASRAEVARLNGLLSRAGGRRPR